MEREVILSYEQHAAKARHNAKNAGAFDCIHYAPNWSRRADALYAQANAEYERSGLKWWEDGGSPFLLEDGRMVLVCQTVWFVESR